MPKIKQKQNTTKEKKAKEKKAKEKIIKKGSRVILLLVVLCVGCGRTEKVYLTSETTEETEERKTDVQETEQEENPFCYVYVCGAVASPGVYMLKDGSRVYEVIQMAGGMTEEAAADAVNQAETVTDGQMLVVMTKEEAEAATSVQVAEESSLVNVNTATAEQLMTLPGIGQAKAASILAYREKNGAFSSVEDIKQIEGIKDGVYSKIKDSITVN